MAASEDFFDDDDRLCGCCFQRIFYMEEPVTLPCGDLFCKGCLGNLHGEMSCEKKIVCDVCK